MSKALRFDNDLEGKKVTLTLTVTGKVIEVDLSDNTLLLDTGDGRDSADWTYLSDYSSVVITEPLPPTTYGSVIEVRGERFVLDQRSRWVSLASGIADSPLHMDGGDFTVLFDAGSIKK